jgi:hypothetical protein
VTDNIEIYGRELSGGGFIGAAVPPMREEKISREGSPFASRKGGSRAVATEAGSHSRSNRGSAVGYDYRDSLRYAAMRRPQGSAA